MQADPTRARTNLLADIGGTNTRVALSTGRALRADSVRRFRNAEFDGLSALLAHYVAMMGGECAGACVAVAGPVQEGVGRLTNLDWSIDLNELSRAAGAETVAILNDLQAQGHALDTLDPANLRHLIGPQEAAQGTKLVIGVGTGFNAAPVYAGPQTLVPPSEAGHVSLPIRDAADLRLSEYIERYHGFASVEDVLSGRGLERIYAWLGAEEGCATQRDAAGIMAGLESGEDARAAATAGVFARLLGSVAGNLALTYLPFGGIYLAGGVARSVAPYLVDLGFEEAFRDKGRFNPFLADFGVFVIEDDFAALIGCANHLHAS